MSQDLEKRVEDLEKRVEKLEKLIASGAKSQDREYIEACKRTEANGYTYYFKTSKDRILEDNGCWCETNNLPKYKNIVKSILINTGEEDLLKGDSEEDYKECTVSLFGKYGKNGYALFDNGFILRSDGGVIPTKPSSKKLKF